MIPAALIALGLVLIALAVRPIRRRPTTSHAPGDTFLPVELLDHWAPLSVDRPERWEAP